MKVLVIGSGGREHALCWKLKQSPCVTKLYAAPGNGGMAGLTECVPVKADDIQGLLTFARKEKINLTVVGPELPLTLGIADVFQQAGLKVFGPSKAAARLEGDKSYAKHIMQKYRVPTAAFTVVTSAADAHRYLDQHPGPIVIKASGLAAGKGVIVCRTTAEARAAVDQVMTKREFGAAGETVVIEEFMEGEEVSVLALTDGKTIRVLAPAQDHKRIFDHDQGPNTGGMGAYAPAPVLTPELAQRVHRDVLAPMIEGMRQEGAPYKGVLYAGLMITKQGPRVVEFNCRFGDPETQAVLPLLKNDLVELMLAVCDGTLERHTVTAGAGAAVCVVVAAGGYPGPYEKGKLITGLGEANALPGTVVFHAGTKMTPAGVVSDGGRVLGVTANAADIRQAIDAAYRACGKIKFDGCFYRKDIGHRALERLK
jgi:phosphoribosylamine--glycine ligase